ncbi:MAG: hypothetical protein IJ781_09380, partial [Atopobiaceae bacterium]|nr:hypothetical protein [Atopobiaceae bacterium]
VEDNFDEGLMEVQTTHEGWTSAEPEVGTWEHDGDTHTLVVLFGVGEGWELYVCGQDEAGNRAHLEGADDVLAYRSKQFNIDLTAPTITCDFDERRRSMATVEGEVAYFASELDLTVTLSDRHLDQESLAVVVDGKPVDTGAWDVGEAEDDTVTKTLVVHYAEGPHQTPEVLACDHAGHQARLEPVPFVVDRTAPELCSVTTSGEPAAHGREHPGDDPTLFFDRPTSLTFDVRDNLGIGSVRLVDPNGIYSASAEGEGFERGDTQVTLSVELREGDGTQGTAFGRDAYLEATDLAGNYRIWTLDSSGKVVDETGSSPENVSLNNGGLHPTALVKDTVPPMVMLSGVEAGSYYNAAQLLHAQVEELNVAYLQRFDASRSVLRITSWTADAQRQPSVLEVPLSLFAGSGSSYAFDDPFAEDGHYAIEAQLVDMANNVSAKEFIGEFTIDKTAPAITLSWDSDAAPTDGYFNTPRTATIVVQEHNFDPGLIDVDTTGSVSSWKSIGDVHTCEVSFGEGGPHRLVVGGRDLAGNVANALKEPVFAVDTTPPSISFGGMAQRSTAQGETTESILEQGGAYNGAVAPSVTFDDDRDLDVESVSLSLRGSKLGEVGEAFPHEVAGGRRSWVVTYEDLGRTKEEGGLPYDIGVDDVYTLVARVRDLAGNEAESSISFSVNRYGSNYLVTAVEGGREVDLSDNPILKDAPTITVREINVSGADPQGTQRVLKEYANRTSVMERHDDGPGGFSLKEIAHDVDNHGWAEYVYTIKSANFGKGSDSDAGDGGQGTYRINVTSDDRAGNANTTAEYWWSDAAREEAKAKAATASFTLDELGPAIDSVDVPARVEPGTSYEASFHVTDAITRGNDVEVWVDGQRVPVQHEGRSLSSGELVGEGSFSFRIPARSFAARKVVIRVSDYARRMDQREVAGLFVTTLIPEALLVLCLLVAARFAYRKSQKE